jgi:2-phosphosulfolactate phosphatase
MQKLHVITHKEALDPRRLSDKVVVVLDVLFATSTMVTALRHGAADVTPVRDAAAARAQALKCVDGAYVLAGERHREQLPGFAHYAPLALLNHDIAGKRVIYATTNGTVALLDASRAPSVYAAALLNGEAVARHIRKTHTDETVLVLCAGSRGALTLEDLYGAGYVVDRLLAGCPQRWALTDAAHAAQKLYRGCEPLECLQESRIGRLMEADGLAHEVRFAARVGVFDIVPAIADGRLRAVDGTVPGTIKPTASV